MAVGALGEAERVAQELEVEPVALQVVTVVWTATAVEAEEMVAIA